MPGRIRRETLLTNDRRGSLRLPTPSVKSVVLAVPSFQERERSGCLGNGPPRKR